MTHPIHVQIDATITVQCPDTETMINLLKAVRSRHKSVHIDTWFYETRGGELVVTCGPEMADAVTSCIREHFDDFL